MLARWSKIFVITTLVVMTGGHWVALQTVAWTTMLASNLRTHSVAEAVADTFDGEHPCPLCKAIAAAKKSEKKSAAVRPGLKQEFPPAVPNTILPPPAQFEILPAANAFGESAFPKPPVPPPRGFPV